jgi:hypothetical protein
MKFAVPRSEISFIPRTKRKYISLNTRGVSIWFSHTKNMKFQPKQSLIQKLCEYSYFLLILRFWELRISTQNRTYSKFLYHNDSYNFTVMLKIIVNNHTRHHLEKQKIEHKLEIKTVVLLILFVFHFPKNRIETPILV